MIKSAQATQAGMEAKFAADTKVAEANRDYELKVAEYTGATNQRKAEADLAYDLQKFKTGQLVKAEEVQVQIIEKQKQIELQQQEILRRQRELEAVVQKPADAERYKVETLANAKRFQSKPRPPAPPPPRSRPGSPTPRSWVPTGIAEAEAQKAKGLAEAAIIEAQGWAQAEAMRQKAESFKQYNEAAVIELIARILPEIAGKISEPLAGTEKMIIINSGSGDGGGASKITGDITQIIAQLARPRKPHRRPTPQAPPTSPRPPPCDGRGSPETRRQSSPAPSNTAARTHRRPSRHRQPAFPATRSPGSRPVRSGFHRHRRPPESDRPVAPQGRQHPAIGRKRQPQNPVLVRQHRHLPKRLQVPKPDRPVVTAGRQGRRWERTPRRSIPRRDRAAPLPPSPHRPQPRRAIRTGRRHPPAIGEDRQAAHVVPVPAKRGAQPQARQRPEKGVPSLRSAERAVPAGSNPSASTYRKCARGSPPAARRQPRRDAARPRHPRRRPRPRSARDGSRSIDNRKRQLDADM